MQDNCFTLRRSERIAVIQEKNSDLQSKIIHNPTKILNQTTSSSSPDVSTQGKSNFITMLSEAQFIQMLQVVRDTVALQNLPQQTKSFSQCNMRFSGDSTEVEHFVNTILLYKEAENISDNLDLKSIPLLLTGEAGIWWQGIKNKIDTFDNAIKCLKSNYIVVKQPYQIY